MKKKRSRRLKQMVVEPESKPLQKMRPKTPPNTQMPGLQQAVKFQHPNRRVELVTESEPKSVCTEPAWQSLWGKNVLTASFTIILNHCDIVSFSGPKIKLLKIERSQTIFPSDGVTGKLRPSCRFVWKILDCWEIYRVTNIFHNVSTWCKV